MYILNNSDDNEKNLKKEKKIIKQNKKNIVELEF